MPLRLPKPCRTPRILSWTSSRSSTSTYSRLTRLGPVRELGKRSESGSHCLPLGLPPFERSTAIFLELFPSMMLVTQALNSPRTRDRPFLGEPSRKPQLCWRRKTVVHFGSAGRGADGSAWQPAAGAADAGAWAMSWGWGMKRRRRVIRMKHTKETSLGSRTVATCGQRLSNDLGI